MKNRSIVPLLALAALVPVAVSLQAKTAIHPSPPAPVPLAETAPVVTLLPTPEPRPRARATVPGTLAASLADHPPLRQRSRAPTVEEWRSADGLNVDGEARCTAFRVREWLRLRCDIERTQQIALLGGEREGTLFAVHRGARNDWWGATKDEIILPIRPGDHRVIGVTTAEMGRYSAGGPFTETLISEQWLDGEWPVVVVQ